MSFLGRRSRGQGHLGQRLEQVATGSLQDHQFQPYSCSKKGKAECKGACVGKRAKADTKDPVHDGCSYHRHSVGDSHPCRDILEHSSEQEKELRFWQ